MVNRINSFRYVTVVFLWNRLNFNVLCRVVGRQLMTNVYVLKSHYSAAVKSKIVHFVIKAPNLVYRYFKSCLLISEWVPPKI